MSSIKDLTPLLLGGAALYVVTKSGVLSGLGQGVGDIAEGAGTAAQGLGGGIAGAAIGVGQGVGQVGYSTQDILQFATAAAGEIGRQSALNIQLREELERSRTIRENTQAQEVDIISHEQTKQPLAEIQSQTDIKVSQEQSTRTIIKEEEKTQWLGRLTQADDALINWGGSKLFSAWKYSPTGLISSWINNIVSVEQNEPTGSASVLPAVTGAAVTTPTLPALPTYSGSSSYKTSSLKTSSTDTTAAVSALPEGASVLSIPAVRDATSSYYEPPVIKLNPKPTFIQKATSFLINRFSFI